MRFVSAGVILALVGAAAPTLAANDQGKAIFAERCVLCHQEDAHGAAGVAPSLVGTLAPNLGSSEGKRYLSQILVSGMIGPIVTEGHKFSGLMPPFRADLSDGEIAAVINYVLGTYNGVADATATSPIAPADVAAASAGNPVATDTRKLRESIGVPR